MQARSDRSDHRRTREEDEGTSRTLLVKAVLGTEPPNLAQDSSFLVAEPWDVLKTFSSRVALDMNLCLWKTRGGIGLFGH